MVQDDGSLTALVALTSTFEDLALDSRPRPTSTDASEDVEHLATFLTAATLSSPSTMRPHNPLFTTSAEVYANAAKTSPSELSPVSVSDAIQGVQALVLEANQPPGFRPSPAPKPFLPTPSSLPRTPTKRPVARKFGARTIMPPLTPPTTMSSIDRQSTPHGLATSTTTMSSIDLQSAPHGLATSALRLTKRELMEQARLRNISQIITSSQELLASPDAQQNFGAVLADVSLRVTENFRKLARFKLRENYRRVQAERTGKSWNWTSETEWQWVRDRLRKLDQILAFQYATLPKTKPVTVFTGVLHVQIVFIILTISQIACIV